MIKQLAQEVLLPIGILFLLTKGSKIIKIVLKRPSLLSVLAFLIYFIQIFIRTGNIYKDLGLTIYEYCPRVYLVDSTLTENQLLACAALMQDNSRQAYQKFGILYCDKCSRMTEYELYFLPRLLAEYLLFLVINGFLTPNFNRIYSTIAIAAALGIEVYLIFNPLSEWISILDFAPNVEFTLLRMFRLGVFCIIVIINHFCDSRCADEIVSNVLQMTLVYTAATTVHSILKDVHFDSKRDSKTSIQNPPAGQDGVVEEQVSADSEYESTDEDKNGGNVTRAKVREIIESYFPINS